jgi:hypothetical protein
LGKDGGDPELGMLTSVDIFVFHEMVKDTSKIDIRILKTDEIGAFKLISGEIHAQGKLVAKVLSKGFCIFKSPDKLRLEFTEPFKSSLIINGNRVFKYEFFDGAW